MLSFLLPRERRVWALPGPFSGVDNLNVSEIGIEHLRWLKDV